MDEFFGISITYGTIASLSMLACHATLKAFNYDAHKIIRYTYGVGVILGLLTVASSSLSTVGEVVLLAWILAGASGAMTVIVHVTMWTAETIRNAQHLASMAESEAREREQAFQEAKRHANR
jgi:hypothetical protein